MKGLLLKDWFVIWKQCRYLLFVPPVFLAVSVLSPDGLFFALFAFLLSAMYPLTVMGLDERSKWEHYALTMPFRRRDLVLSKYALSLLSIAINAAIYLLLLLIFSHDPETLQLGLLLIAAGISIACLYTALAYPFLFKLGMEKGRLWYLILIAVAGAGGGALISLSGEAASWDGLIPLLNKFLFFAPFAALLLFGFSAFLSVFFYNRREF